MVKTYAIVGNKGGILKTTLAVNIAAELSKKYKVLIIDTDGQSNVGITFGIRVDDDEVTLFDCLTEGKKIEDAIINVSSNLDIVPSGRGMNKYSHTEDRSIADLKNALGNIKANYHYIFIDTAPSINFATAQAMYAADEMIVPFQPEGYGMMSLVETIRTTAEAKEKINPELEINCVVVTKYDSKSKVHKKFLLDCKAACKRAGIRIADTKIPQTSTASTSVLEEQKPTVLSKKWYKLKGIYANLTKEVVRQ